MYMYMYMYIYVYIYALKLLMCCSTVGSLFCNSLSSVLPACRGGGAMVCYGMLGYGMLCISVCRLRYGMLWFVMVCYVMVRYGMLCISVYMLWYVMLCYGVCVCVCVCVCGVSFVIGFVVALLAVCRLIVWRCSGQDVERVCMESWFYE